MQCNNCPLFLSWNNESDRGEACALFGDGWDSQFMYKRNNQIWGCYIEKAYINKVEQRIEKYMDIMENGITFPFSRGISDAVHTQFMKDDGGRGVQRLSL